MSTSFNDISVTCIAQTRVNREAVRKWLDSIGATEFEIPPEEQVADPALLVALAAKQCYMAFQPGLNPNVTKVRSDMVDYLDNVLKQRHGSVLEHSVFSFAIDGCSRVFTGEMNRHRPGVAISERSMRFIRYDAIRFWMPECFRIQASDSSAVRGKKLASQKIMQQEFDAMEETQAAFANIWKEELAPESSFHGKKTLTSAFRRVIGMGIATGGVWSLNIRALRHVLTVRTDEGAEEEAVHVIGKIGKYMLSELDELFPDFQLKGKSYVPDYWKV